MKTKLSLAAFALLIAGAAYALDETKPESPAETYEMPKPTKEHQWLDRLVGEWESTGEITMAPGQEPIKSKASETVRSLGGFWTVAQSEGECMGQKVSSVMTLGYDPESKKYVGTWVDSVMPHLWKYEGTVDESGDKLTLLSEGPDMMTPGKMCKFKEVMEFKSDDHRVFTSAMQMEDGSWNEFVKVDSRRRK
jgi:hypothetical protein